MLIIIKISVVIPTRDRPKDLLELLFALLKQHAPPFEVIIVDDSSSRSVKRIINFFASKFRTIGTTVKYIRGSGEGLPSARNIGVNEAEGDAILFLDDDTILDRNVISIVSDFLDKHPEALGLQVNIVGSKDKRKLPFAIVGNLLNKIFMLGYCEPNKLQVRRSGAYIFPKPLTKIITAQRLSGCCCCYRRRVFNEFKFDEKLKGWANMEDIDFSYRIYKKYPHSLYAIPDATIIHKGSQQSKLPEKIRIYMSIIYWFYVFFKDVFDGSILNLLAFLWALLGNLAATIGGLIIKRKTKIEWWNLIYLLEAYLIAFKNLKDILQLKLDFFNQRMVGR